MPFAVCVTKLVTRDGEIEETDRALQPIQHSQPCVVPGRRPEGLCAEVQWSPAAELGAYFALMAHFEAASISAFEVLSHELAQHGAPPELVERARLAARDERRHAALTAAQAQRFGATPVIPKFVPQALRSLAAIALDNATEGAVRETYSALLACHEAKAARDPQIAGVKAQLARDELAHAALAFDIDAWIRPQLDAATQLRVAAAQRVAVEALTRDCEHEPSAAQRDLAGVPDAATARAMCAVLEQQLWRATASGTA